MENLLYILSSALLSVTPLPQGITNSWCQRLPVRGHILRELKDVEVKQVRTDRLAAAVSLLSKVRLVRLKSRVYYKLVGKPPRQSSARFLYLVRAGFMATNGLSGVELAKEGRQSWYTVYEDNGEATVNITSLLTSYGRDQIQTGYPLVLVSPRRIKHVTTTCIGGA